MSSKETHNKEYERQNDLYVFCLNKNKDINNNDPLRLDDWVFYVVPTFRINKYAKERQKTITLNVVRRLSGKEVKFDQLKGALDQVINEINANQ